MTERTKVETGLFDILKEIIDGEWGPYPDDFYWSLVAINLPRLGLDETTGRWCSYCDGTGIVPGSEKS